MTAHQIQLAARPVDPLAPNPPGMYIDDRVIVVRGDPSDLGTAPGSQIVATAHFGLRRRGQRIEVRQWLRSGELDNDLAGLLGTELFAPGWLSGADVFERVFTGVVRSCVDDPIAAWVTFYRNTLARIRECWDAPAAADPAASSIAGFAPVYRRALRLIAPGRVLDLGSCFGFLPLLLAGRPMNTVIASDLAPGALRLLETAAHAFHLRVDTVVCDAAQVPLPDNSVDTVTVIHLLEHLDRAHSDAVVREALRLARRRVVVAVPFDDEPTAAYGHIQSFNRAALTSLGQRLGHQFAVAEHHGGWLVLHVG